MPSSIKLPAISEHIWDQKYRLKAVDGRALDATLSDTWARVAKAAAAAEKKRDRARWEAQFFAAMDALEFLPAGRIIAGAGSGREVTLFNCFVMGRIEDDLTSIFDNVKEAALTMQRGGGIGHDFSTLRPEGALVKSVGAGASGPVSFMDVWDSMCRTIMSAGQRRGAMMATLSCDHPDIETFIDAKAMRGRLTNFNLSVLVTDAFMAAVRDDRDWALTFEGKVFRTVRARALWDRIMQATYAYAEPGVIFIDRINQRNNLAYCEEIRATNPCGEQPLPPHGACLLGSINLARLVGNPFTPDAHIDEARLAALATLAVRFLDNVIDVSDYPLAAQRKEAKAKRRIGLGLTGLADALAMTGLSYGSPEAAARAKSWMQTIEHAAYLASAELAREKGAFPLYEAAAFLGSPNIARLDGQVRDAITRHGIRNGCLTSIAPTGTISLLAGNVSSGIEPIFDLAYTRRIREAGDSVREERVEDYAHAIFRQLHGADAPLPSELVTTATLAPHQHLAMQAAIQAHVDSSISKTINCPEAITFDAFKGVYQDAYDQGLKGCTTFRPNPVTGSVLVQTPVAASGAAQGRGQTAGSSVASNPQVFGQRSDTGSDPIAIPAVTTGLPEKSRISATTERAVPETGPEPGVVYLSRPLERDPALPGFTYKLKWNDSDHAIYVTINDTERDGRRRPFEIFINSKNLEHYAWTVALTRMISAVFRRGGDVTFVVDELKAIFDPQGGQWMDGRYVPSLLAAIGGIIEAHMQRTGFLAPPAAGHAADTDSVMTPERPRRRIAAEQASIEGVASAANTEPMRALRAGKRCPRCVSGTLTLDSGCWLCRNCGYSKCH